MNPIEATTFRADKGVKLVVWVVFALFAVLALAVFVKNGDLEFLAWIVAVAGLLFLMLGRLRLVIGPSGFTYRRPLGSATVAFAKVERAWFEMLQHKGVRAAHFRLRSHDQVVTKLSLKLFPVEAAAMLFTGLEAHGVAVEFPDEWHAKHLVEQIRAAQARSKAASGRGLE